MTLKVFRNNPLRQNIKHSGVDCDVIAKTVINLINNIITLTPVLETMRISTY
jgi:hypothetical protein